CRTASEAMCPFDARRLTGAGPTAEALGSAPFATFEPAAAVRPLPVAPEIPAVGDAPGTRVPDKRRISLPCVSADAEEDSGRARVSSCTAPSAAAATVEAATTSALPAR